MVCDTENPSLRAASCWSVEVVKGGAGALRSGFTATVATLNVALWQDERNALASALD